MKKNYGRLENENINFKEKSKEIQKYLYSLMHCFSKTKTEALISVDPIFHFKNVHKIRNNFDTYSNINTNQILISRCGLENRNEFYMPIFSPDLQKNTFRALLKIIEHSRSKITVLILEKNKSFFQKMISSLGLTYMLPPLSEELYYEEHYDEIMGTVLRWSKFTQKCDTSFFAYYSPSPFTLPRKGFIVSDTENHFKMMNFLNEKNIEMKINLKRWYKVSLLYRSDYPNEKNENLDFIQAH